MTFDIHTISEAGGRGENQDRIGSRRAGDYECWVVADGLGGHRGGSTAASLAVDIILQAFADAPDCSPQAVRSYLDAAEAAVGDSQRADPALRSMRTTAVVLVTRDGEAVWGHVGDSRLYYFQSGRIATQTSDHSVPQMLADAGEITRTAIRFHEDRSSLLRAIGSGPPLRPAVLEALRRLSPGDAFLLCTDGFWEYVDEDRMEEELRRAPDAREWLDRMRGAVVAAAATDHDNYSAAAILVRP